MTDDEYTPSMEDLKRAWFKYRNAQTVTPQTRTSVGGFDAGFNRALADHDAGVWAKAYGQGVQDERTSEANIGIAGMGMKINPARTNPYESKETNVKTCTFCGEATENATTGSDGTTVACEGCMGEADR